MHHARIVDDDVSPAIGAPGEVSQRFDLSVIGDVAGEPGRIDFQTVQLSNRLVQFGLAAAGNDDLCAVIAKLLGERKPNAGRAAGDDHDLVLITLHFRSPVY